jgi:hypothetical protein
MTATLWLDTVSERTIELGGTLQLYEAFSSMAAAAGGGYLVKWPDLFGVVTQVESQEDADPEWLDDMRREAAAFLEQYRGKISEHAVWVLEQLTG